MFPFYVTCVVIETMTDFNDRSSTVQVSKNNGHSDIIYELAKSQ